MITKVSIDEALRVAVKQMIININNDDKYNGGIHFNDNGMSCFLLISMGDYNIVFDETNQRLIGTWSIHINDDRTGTWGQGYYFMPEDDEDDMNKRYKINEVVSWLLDKVQRD